ncbi:faciogenital dysplasia protein [Anaeramoeba flamelloides]|uniref:Faciogenital dysplasia protein n=1 Tax=Anaeramoeba flamelloides TaxID=1746091 RepID=A0AAV7YRW8_9EUKA|nr:faciogenital dysplasia protein [Anaeramoeba flamelloides]
MKRYLSQKKSSKLSVKYSRREKAVRELLTTERTYVERLDILCTLFRETIEEQTKQRHSFITKEEYRSIFFNVDEVYEIHSKNFLPLLEGRIGKEWKHGQICSDLFDSMSDWETGYSNFCKDYEKALKEITRIRQKKDKFDNLLLELKNHENNQGFDITSLLILPVQRVPRYNLLLKEILKHTEKEHPDYDQLQIALDNSKKLATKINKYVQLFENLTKLHEIQAQFESGKMDIAFLGRSFIEQTTIQIISKNNTLHKRYFFLFNDLFIIADKKFIKFRYKHFSTLSESWIQDVPPLPEHKNLIFFIDPNLTMVIIFENAEKKEKWIKNVSQAIAKQLEIDPTGIDRRIKVKLPRRFQKQLSENLTVMKILNNLLPPKKGCFATTKIFGNDNIFLGNFGMNLGSSSSAIFSRGISSQDVVTSDLKSNTMENNTNRRSQKRFQTFYSKNTKPFEKEKKKVRKNHQSITNFDMGITNNQSKIVELLKSRRNTNSKEKPNLPNISSRNKYQTINLRQMSHSKNKSQIINLRKNIRKKRGNRDSISINLVNIIREKRKIQRKNGNENKKINEDENGNGNENMDQNENENENENEEFDRKNELLDMIDEINEVDVETEQKKDEEDDIEDDINQFLDELGNEESKTKDDENIPNKNIKNEQKNENENLKANEKKNDSDFKEKQNERSSQPLKILNKNNFKEKKLRRLSIALGVPMNILKPKKVDQSVLVQLRQRRLSKRLPPPIPQKNKTSGISKKSFENNNLNKQKQPLTIMGKQEKENNQKMDDLYQNIENDNKLNNQNVIENDNQLDNQNDINKNNKLNDQNNIKNNNVLNNQNNIENNSVLNNQNDIKKNDPLNNQNIIENNNQLNNQNDINKNNKLNDQNNIEKNNQLSNQKELEKKLIPKKINRKKTLEMLKKDLPNTPPPLPSKSSRLRKNFSAPQSQKKKIVNKIPSTDSNQLKIQNKNKTTIKPKNEKSNNQKSVKKENDIVSEKNIKKKQNSIPKLPQRKVDLNILRQLRKNKSNEPPPLPSKKNILNKKLPQLPPKTTNKTSHTEETNKSIPPKIPPRRLGGRGGGRGRGRGIVKVNIQNRPQQK